MHTINVTDDQLATIDAALEWIDEIYPAEIFDGSSGDEGPVRIVAIREKLRQTLAALRAAQPGTEPHNGVWTEQAVRNMLGEPINGRDDNSWVDYELAFGVAMRIIGHYETWIANARRLLEE